jgi:hypothetical protein
MRLSRISSRLLLSLVMAWAAPRATAQATDGGPALPARPQPTVGRPFGELVLPTLDGSRSVDLDVYRGRKVLLIEFASW